MKFISFVYSSRIAAFDLYIANADRCWPDLLSRVLTWPFGLNRLSYSQLSLDMHGVASIPKVLQVRESVTIAAPLTWTAYTTAGCLDICY